MGKVSRITREVAEAILESFRAAPGNAQGAAKHAGCDRRTTKKAWEFGLRSCPDPRYHVPFQQIIQQEQLETRARMVEDEAIARQRSLEAEAQRQQNVRTKAIEDVTNTRAAEGTLVRMARTTTGLTLQALAQTGAGVAKVSQLVRMALEALVVRGDAGVVCVVNDPIAYQKERSTGGDGHQHLRAMGLAEAKGYTKTLATFATALRQVNDAAQKALEMERLLLGEPTQIIGHRHLETMTMDEAEKHVEAASRAFKRLKDKGVTVLDDAPLDPKLH